MQTSPRKKVLEKAREIAADLELRKIMRKTIIKLLC